MRIFYIGVIIFLKLTDSLFDYFLANGKAVYVSIKTNSLYFYMHYRFKNNFRKLAYEAPTDGTMGSITLQALGLKRFLVVS